MTTAVDFRSFAPQVEAALRGEFPQDTIDLEEGYMGRVLVRIVSSKFNEMKEKSRQAFVWDVLRNALGPDAQNISMVIPYGTDELP
jgi:hypothetical protein